MKNQKRDQKEICLEIAHADPDQEPTSGLGSPYRESTVQSALNLDPYQEPRLMQITNHIII
mgnify:CR=1 FL=1